MRPDFTERRFLGFPEEQQHKKCAEILRAIYEAKQAGLPALHAQEAYGTIVKWLGLAPLNDSELKTLADRYHEHLKIATVKHKEHNLLPEIRRGDKAEAEKAWPIVVYLDHIRSAHNVGSILRTIEAFAFGKACFSDGMPLHTDKQVQDAAMGAGQWVECIHNTPFELLPQPIIALETSPAAVSLFDFVFPETFTLVLGNEEYGCSDHTLQKADMLVEIPLRGHKNSLNVANAFAIAAAEIYRQRNEKSSIH